MNSDSILQNSSRHYKPLGPCVLVFHVVAGLFLLLGAAVESHSVREGSFSLLRLMMAVSGVGLLVTVRGAALWKVILRYLAYGLFVGVIGAWIFGIRVDH